MKFSLLLLLCCCAINGMGQNIIKGTVSDTLNVRRLYRASVVLVSATDSAITSHTRTGVDGSFELKAPAQGRYILRISAISFADYLDVINVKKEVTDVGDIPLVTREHLLSEFVITQQIAAIKIKGDTTEYMADSFKVKTGATVEDLLKRLPGIQVDKNGKVTAQGETVQKILVDGEEFFSDDPKVVTQGLQAGIVNKVQVYDKKSDQAEFTGIDDGQKTKTINLEIKEDKKKGFFGKLEAGGAPDGYYQGQAMINAFRGKRQLSAFGIASNTDKVGLDWNDNDKYGGNGGMVTEVTDNGISMMATNVDDFGGWSGRYEGQGLPKVRTTGLHFANRWNEDKDHVSGSYRYALQNVNIDATTTTQASLAGDTTRLNIENKKQFSNVERHGLNTNFEIKIDSSSSLRLLLDAGMKNASIASVYHTQTWNRTTGDGPVTLNDRTLTGNTKDQYINADILFRKKFAKKGRTLSVSGNEKYNEVRGQGLLNATTTAPAIAGGSDISQTNQKKTDTSSSLMLTSKITYTEPLSKTAFIEGNYGITINNSRARKSSFDRAPGSAGYDVLNDTFSSNYRYNILSHAGGLAFKFVYKTYNFSFGSDIANTAYRQTDVLHNDTTHTYSYLNFYPSANFVYKFAKQTSLHFSYKGNTRQPTIEQIQPLKQNTDPLNVTLGNPALKQQFDNEFTLRFNDYKVLSQRYTYLGASYSATYNSISTSQVIEGPVSTTQYINVNGNYSGNMWGGYELKLKKADLSLGLQVNGNTSHQHNMINYKDNVSDNNSFSLGPTLSKAKEDKYEFRLEPKVTYNSNRSAISLYSANYWEFNGDVNGDVNISKKLEVGTSVNIMIREKTQAFPTNNELVKWNAFVEQKFLKNDQLVARLTLYDILNQNTGINRTSRATLITQENYNTIRRYIMLSLTWNFTYTPGLAKGAADTKTEN